METGWSHLPRPVGRTNQAARLRHNLVRSRKLRMSLSIHHCSTLGSGSKLAKPVFAGITPA